MQIINLNDKKTSIMGIKSSSKKDAKTKEYGPFYIVSELSHKNYSLIKKGDLSIVIPKGVTMENKAGSRILNFICEDHKIARVLIDSLENCGMNWDETVERKEINLEQLEKILEEN